MSDLAIALSAWGALMLVVIGIGVKIAQLPRDLERAMHDAEQADRNGPR